MSLTLQGSRVLDTARIVSAGKLEAFVTSIPNIKIGAHLNQDALNRLYELEQRGAAGADDAMYDFWFSIMEDRVEGVRQRQNALIAQMQLGTIVYDRFGVKITQDFNVPADLKANAATVWSDVNAVPVTDIEAIRNNARDKYGRQFNRMTLPRADFDNMTATTQFKNLSTSLFGFAVTTAAVNTGNRVQMEQFAGRILGMELEIEDHTYRTQESDGKETVHRDLPLGKVLLGDTADDNDPRVMDLANAVVTESMVAEMMGGRLGVDLAGQQFGPVGYWTPQDPTLDPPGILAWAVARCFPRRRQRESVAVLTVR
jgi:hypothetical protein